MPVTLSVSRGSLETNRIFVSDGGGVVKLRSAGLGPATVSARAPGWLPVQTTIIYRWPLVFLAAALLGGLLGAFVGLGDLGRRSRSALVRSATRGTLVGLVVCAVYFGIGINLLQFQVDVRFFNEIAVFALAALAAMFGIPALSALDKRRGRAPGS
jgi:NO-binding membrane sensor protein with MHYT domain